MYSTKNSLKVFVSPLLGQTNLLNVTDLKEGELGFFNKATGALIADGIGEGYFALMKDSIVLKSKALTFAGYAADLKDYTAPTLRQETIAVPTATTGALYQINVEIKIPGIRGEYFLHGSHVAVSGDSTTTIATALAASLNSQLTREGKTNLLTVSSATATITITSILQNYVQGKLHGRPASFRSRLTYPEDDALLATVAAAASDGIGYGPYIMEKEYLAQGDSDPHRQLDWRNNFDWVGNAVVTGEYDVIVLQEENQQKTANARVDAPMEYIVVFNTLGATPSPIIDASVDGDTTVTGVSYPGASVILSVDGAPESAVTAHATTGVWTVTVTVATGEVLTATAQSGSNPISAVSDSVTVTAT